jgi:hypothetical protein
MPDNQLLDKEKLHILDQKEDNIKLIVMGMILTLKRNSSHK